jgi:hypothetical protein
MNRLLSAVGGVLLLGAIGVLFYGGWELSQDVARLSQQMQTLTEQVTVLNRRIQTLNELSYAFRPPVAESPNPQRRVLKTEADKILHEAKTLSWAYYKEHGSFPRTADDIALHVPTGSAWNRPVVVAGGGPKARTIRWLVSGNGTQAVTSGDQCYLVLDRDGSSRQGCNF